METKHTTEEMLRCLSIAKTIHQQFFMSIDMNVFFSWGVSAKFYRYYNGMPSLDMVVSGCLHKGHVVISLNEGADTYEVRLFKEKHRYLPDTATPIKTVTDIYCDVLGSVVDGLVERAVGTTDDDYHAMAMADSASKWSE